MKGFRNLIVWQKAYGLVLEIYKISRQFPREEFYGLRSQITRAAVSISANIAEGYERSYRKEYLRFLAISKGSLGEVENYLMLSRDLNYIQNDQYNDIDNKRQEVGKILRGLMNSLQHSS